MVNWEGDMVIVDIQKKIQKIVIEGHQSSLIMLMGREIWYLIVNYDIFRKGRKGSASRDFRPPVFFMVRTHLGP